MKVGRIFLFVFIILAGVGGYLGYIWYGSKSSDKKIIDYVPNNSVFVISSKNPSKSFIELQNQSLDGSFLAMNIIKDLKSPLEVLNTTLEYEASDLTSFIGEGTEAILTFVLTDNGMSPYFILKMKEDGQSILEKLYQNSSSTKETLTIQNTEVHSLSHDKLQTPIYFTFKDGFLLLCKNSEVFENTLAPNFSAGRFSSDYSKVQKNEAISSSVHVYVKYNLLPQLTSKLVRSGDAEIFNAISDFSFIDIHSEKSQLNFTGYSYGVDSIPTLLNAFKNQQPGSFYLRNFVSNRTAVLYYWGFDNYQELSTSLDNYWYANFDNQEEQRQSKFQELYGVSFDKFNSLIVEEVGLSVFEVKNGYHDKITYVKINDEQSVQKVMLETAKTITGKDSLKSESFEANVIYKHPISELPELLFGKHFEGYDQCYYTFIDDYLVIGNNAASLKVLITDIVSDNVWGKTINTNRFLEDSFEKANLGIFVNLKKSWNSIQEIISNDYLSSIEKSKVDYAMLDMLSLTYTHEENNNKVYTSGALKFTSNIITEVVEAEDTTKNSMSEIELKSKVIVGPNLVKNHTNGSKEIILAKADSTISLLSTKADLLWNAKLDGNVISDIHQVDIFRNGKLQYLFATQNQVYCVDRKGRFVENYPYKLPNKLKINTLSLIDYDNSRRYRILVSDTVGSLYMFNSKAENLEGWNPNKIGSKLGAPAKHVRTRGKDFIVAIEASGKLNVFNRRGELENGFPIELAGGVLQPFIPELGASVRKSYMNILTTTNEFFEISFKGKVTGNEIIKGDEDNAIIQMIQNTLVDMPVFVIMSKNRVRFLSHEYKLLFDVKLVGVTKARILTIGGKNYYLLQNIKNGESFIVNSKGKIINNEPILSSTKIAVDYSPSSKVYTVYSSIDSKFFVTSFQEKN